MKKNSLVFCLIIFLLASCAKQNKNSLTDVKPVNVKFEPVITGSLAQDFETAGELKADKEILVSAERLSLFMFEKVLGLSRVLA